MTLKKQIKLRAVNIALMATLILTGLKIVVAAVTGSVGVLSEAIHSSLDLISSLLTRVTVGISNTPADADHPFGHGKLEDISALFEAFLLIIAGIYILYESILHAKHGHEVTHVNWAIAVILFSMFVNLAVYIQNRNVGKEHESIAIETNAYHFLTDFFSSAIVLIGLVTIKFTSLQWIDSLAAVTTSLYIFGVAGAQMKRCLEELSDKALSSLEMTEIQEIIKKHSKSFVDFHDLRTRKVGASRHVDMHLTVCAELTVHDAHKVCDQIEDDIKKRFEDNHVSIHTEPCDHHIAECGMVCPYWKKRNP